MGETLTPDTRQIVKGKLPKPGQKVPEKKRSSKESTGVTHGMDGRIFNS